jgi:hypothetical protein
MKTHPGAIDGDGKFSQATADDAPASLTYAATAGESHVVDYVTACYDNTAANKALTITVGGTEVWRAYVSSQAGGHFEFPKGVYTGAMLGDGEALVISLAASGTGGTTGYLSVGARTSVTPT